MKVQVLLADTGRPTGANTLNLLNAGWSFTYGPPQPAQAVAVFLEVPWGHLNKQLNVQLELVDDEGQVQNVQFPDGPQPATISYPVLVGNVPGAPTATPGSTALFFELGPGALNLPAGHRYTWKVSVDGEHEEAWEASFWVQPPMPEPQIGGSVTG